jgi:hypothetical protein
MFSFIIPRQKSINFTATNTGQYGTLQNYTIPETGNYSFKVCGAEGSGGNIYGLSHRPIGGKGGCITGHYSLISGETLWIVVGQQGSHIDATQSDGTSGGGGGGSFIFRIISTITNSNYQFTKSGTNFEVLFVAAGGGGSREARYTSSYNGLDGNANPLITPNNYVSPYTQTCNPSTNSDCHSPGGIYQFISYDLAGCYFKYNDGYAYGGYGGGGASDDYAPAGGGWAQATTSSPYSSNSFSIDNYATGITGFQTGDGYVTIESTIKIPNHTPQPSPTIIPCPSESIISIPEGTITISPYQYYKCSNIIKVIFPNSLKSIDIGSFQFCSGLINLSIPQNLTLINALAFYGCTNLTKLTIFGNIQINSQAFHFCSSLTHIIIYILI